MRSDQIIFTILAITELEGLMGVFEGSNIKPVKATVHLNEGDRPMHGGIEAAKGLYQADFTAWPEFDVVFDDTIDKSCVVLEGELDRNWPYNFEGMADIYARYYGDTMIVGKQGLLATTFEGDNKKPITPQIVIFVEGGVVTGAIANVPIEVVVYDRDNIAAGDPEPIDEDEARKTMQEVL
jgi:hypothetical protein